MVRLFNISIQGNTISCDYTPEASDDIGRVTMNMVTFEVIDINFSDYEYGKKCMRLMYAQNWKS